MQQLTQRVLEMAVTIQQIPAPTFDEGLRGAFIASSFTEEGLADISTDEAGNVYGRIPGADPTAKPLVVSAHLDTVFPHGTKLDITKTGAQIYGPGIGDNSMGVAGMFGLLWSLREKAVTLPGDVWLVANVGEEGLGDLNGMRAVVDRFGAEPRAYIVLEGMALGHVYDRALGVRRFKITANTLGGHSWAHFGRPSAIHELAKLVAIFDGFKMPQHVRTTFNVGMISGGRSINTIAPEAELLLDLRSEDQSTLADLVQSVAAEVEQANTAEVSMKMEKIGDRPAGKIAEDHPLIRLAIESLESLGIAPQLNIGSTDANIPLSLGIPATTIGLTTGGGAHTTGEFIYTEPLSQGLAHLQMLVQGVFEVL